ncbi:MAG: GNAT family N-acetyltransferase [Alphaproteobacteria bacterium]
MTDTAVERLLKFSNNDLAELCEAADTAIVHGGGFGWLAPPRRDVMEAYWRGVLLIPERTLFAGRLENVIAGSAQLARPPTNAEARAHAASVSTFFLAPWARGHGLAPAMLEACEELARKEGYTVLNLDVRETQTRAIQIFETRGYKCWGTDPKYARVKGAYVAGRFYQRDL